MRFGEPGHESQGKPQVRMSGVVGEGVGGEVSLGRQGVDGCERFITGCALEVGEGEDALEAREG